MPSLASLPNIRTSGFQAASSTLMRNDFGKRTSLALMTNSGFGFPFLRVPTSSGEAGAPSSSRRLNPMVASRTRKISNPSSLILVITCAIWSDSEREPLMASPSSFISFFSLGFTLFPFSIELDATPGKGVTAKKTTDQENPRPTAKC